MASYLFLILVFLGVFPFALGLLSYVLFDSQEQKPEDNSQVDAQELAKSTTS